MDRCPRCGFTETAKDAGRARKPRDPARWPPEMTQEQIEAEIDNLCGCGGRRNCDCVSVFNIARREAWYRRNAQRRA